MSYYRTCPHCGANLDPGERCGCFGSRYADLTPLKRTAINLVMAMSDAQCAEVLRRMDEKTAAGAGDTNDGKETPHSS